VNGHLVAAATINDSLDPGLLGYLQRVVDLDAKVAGGALESGVPDEKLHRRDSAPEQEPVGTQVRLAQPGTHGVPGLLGDLKLQCTENQLGQKKAPQCGASVGRQEIRSIAVSSYDSVATRALMSRHGWNVGV